MHRILIVDDNPVICQVHGRFLNECGYTTETVQDGHSAIELIQKKPDDFDLILMDVDLDDSLNGPETASIILELVHIPILFVSSHTEKDIVEKAESIGSYGYVVKDSGFAVLHASIKMAFRLHRSKVRELKRKTELEKSEARYRDVIEKVHESIVVFKNSRPVFFNEQALRTFGYSAEEFISLSLNELVYPDDLSLVEHRHQERVAGHIKDEPYVTRWMDNDGKIIYIRINPKRVAWGDGYASLGILEDITEQKQLRDALRRSEQLLGVAADNLNGILYIVNQDLNFILARGNGLRKLRLYPELVTGNSLERVFADREDREEFVNYHKKVLETAGSVFFESEYRGFRFETALTPVWNDDQTVTGVVGVSMDMTERLKSEQEKEEIHTQLKERIKELQCIYDVVMVLSKEESAGERFSKLVNTIPRGWYYPDDTCCSIVFDGITYYSDSYTETRWCLSEDITVSGQVRGEVRVYYKSEHPPKDEGPFLNEERQLLIAIAANTGMQLEKNEAGKELEATLAYNQQLLRELQHRAKNSFAMISGMIQLMKAENPDADTKLLETLEYRVNAMAELYSLLYRSGSTDQVNIGQYLDQIIRTIPVDKSGVTIEADIEPVQVPFDLAMDIGLIVTELITNSLKHAFNGQQKGLIQICCGFTQSGLIIGVSDNGKGLPDDFNPGRTETFGLKLASSLAKKSGGSFEIRSDQGAHFTLKILTNMQS